MEHNSSHNHTEEESGTTTQCTIALPGYSEVFLHTSMDDDADAHVVDRLPEGPPSDDSSNEHDDDDSVVTEKPGTEFTTDPLDNFITTLEERTFANDIEEARASEVTGSSSSLAVGHPAMWAISFQQLVRVQKKLVAAFGMDKSQKFTMRDVNHYFIQPTCQKKGTSYALFKNPQGLKTEAFVTHCWDEIFNDFVARLQQCFALHDPKPNLWICSFAINQDPDSTESLLSESIPIEQSPFVLALQHASMFVVVRNWVTDLYSRSWCVCELHFALRAGLIPSATYIAGPNAFLNSTSSCLEAKASRTSDQKRIQNILKDHRDEADGWVGRLRQVGNIPEHLLGQPLSQLVPDYTMWSSSSLPHPIPPAAKHMHRTGPRKRFNVKEHHHATSLFFVLGGCLTCLILGILITSLIFFIFWIQSLRWGCSNIWCL